VAQFQIEPAAGLAAFLGIVDQRFDHNHIAVALSAFVDNLIVLDLALNQHGGFFGGNALGRKMAGTAHRHIGAACRIIECFGQSPLAGGCCIVADHRGSPLRLDHAGRGFGRALHGTGHKGEGHQQNRNE
jgi:hypothetical protein